MAEDGHTCSRRATSSTTGTIEDARESEVDTGQLWFDPAAAEVAAGQTAVNVRFIITGQAFHGLTVRSVDVVLAARPDEQAVGAGVRRKGT